MCILMLGRNLWHLLQLQGLLLALSYPVQLLNQFRSQLGNIFFRLAINVLYRLPDQLILTLIKKVSTLQIVADYVLHLQLRVVL